MKNEKIKIIDESGDKNYFTIIPNYIANHSTANDQALYFQMKRTAGENGICATTQGYLSKQLGIKKDSIRKSLKYLISKEWVSFVGTSKFKTHPINTYKINDIWKINSNFYESKRRGSQTAITSKIDREEAPKQPLQEAPKVPVEEEPYKEDTIANSKKPKDSRITEVINFFHQSVLKDKGFKPHINGGLDGSMIENLLKTYSSKQIQDIIEFYIQGKDVKKYGYNLRFALNSISINKWLEQEAFDIMDNKTIIY